MRLSDLQDRMRAGATLLTPNQRAARLWRERLIHAEPALLPAVMPWATWKESQWHAALVLGHDDRVLLNSTQNAALWEQILQNAQPQTLRPVRSLVQLCLQAQHLVHSHGAAARLLDYIGDAGTDPAHFADWFRSFTRWCDRDGLLPASALDDALAALPTPVACTELLLLGFDSVPPSTDRLLGTLAAAGVRVQFLDAGTVANLQPQPATVMRCADGFQELSFLSGGLHQQVAQAQGSIVVILPDAEASRPSLERHLREAFRAGGTEPWEFSTGPALATLPLAADALHLLRWTQEPATAATAGALLRSPYLALGVDAETAAELDAEVLRANGQLRPEWTLRALATRCAHFAPALQAALRTVDAAAGQTRGQRSAGEWTEVVADVLRAAGWPGARERTSTEFQIVDRWNDLLDALASLDLFGGAMPFPQFLLRLEEGARQLRFSAENTGAPIQILSPDEARGTTADMLWFAQVDEAGWSGRQSTSPLLPWSLQADFAMPGTSPARDAEAHHRTTERLLRSASHTIVSYPAADSTGDLRSAAVLESFQLAQTDAPPTPADNTGPILDELQDDTAPALPQDAGVLGGVGVLQSQAACAFRAFAERRLYSTEPESPQVGLDARDRGNLLHGVLDLFWTATRTQAELLRLQQSGTLNDSIQHHIDAVLPGPASGDGWSKAYISIQRRRLHHLVRQWLDYEAQRPPFTVVETEREVEAELHPLRFRVRVDRIDAVETADDPALVLIDYKTGSTTASGWLGPRPDEPQLPFYAVAADLEQRAGHRLRHRQAGRTQSWPAGHARHHRTVVRRQVRQVPGAVRPADGRVARNAAAAQCRLCRRRCARRAKAVPQNLHPLRPAHAVPAGLANAGRAFR